MTGSLWVIRAEPLRVSRRRANTYSQDFAITRNALHAGPIIWVQSDRIAMTLALGR
jgi:hypothetical protein